MPAPRALIASYYVPQPDLDSSSRRLHHLVRFLLEEGWEVTVAAKNPVRSPRPARALGQLGVPVFAPIGAEVRERIASHGFDVAILAFWYVAELLLNDFRRSSPATSVIVDSMDLHFVRHARHTFNPEVKDRATEALDETYAWETTRELNAYGGADGVLAVSQKEADLVSDLIGDPGLGHVVPDCEDLDRSPFEFEERRGILFIGNFEHRPNVDAVRYLCEQVVPRLDPALLAAHPLTIIGNQSESLLALPGIEHPQIEVVGWVPSVIPYLERTRVSLIPLLYGAGTKRKLIQSLMLGTPAVSTTVGIEALGLEHDGEVLVADSPPEFADSIETLLVDRERWERLSTAGRDHILTRHGRATAKERLFEAISAVRARQPKSLVIPVPDWVLTENEAASPAYQGLVRRVRRAVRQVLPNDAKVIVASRGDPELVDLAGRDAWHYPRDAATGQYAGFHPADSADAITHLETLREIGGEFLLVPSPQAWMLDHYDEFARHLETHFDRVLSEDDTCTIFDLRQEPGKQPATERREPSIQAPPSADSGGEAVLSVVIPTHNRAELLAESLASLANQRLSRERFEVVVVDDGSTDATGDVCREFTDRLPVRHHPIERCGIAAAKNAGALEARGDLVLFFDDDDLADRGMLLEHVRAHERHPDEEVAVLGHTEWAPSLEISEVMHFVTDVGHYLFAYDGLSAGEELDFTYFWGGRTSAKRSFLVDHGLFRPEFTFGSEDIELAYRLAQHGLRVVYWPQAVQYMNRPITYEEFCRRCERQGVSQWQFSRMHADAAVQEYCGTAADVEDRWRELEAELTERRALAAQLEEELRGRPADEALRKRLWQLYWWTFDASKVKGIIEAKRSSDEAMPVTA